MEVLTADSESIGLLMLAPARIADKALVADQQALAADGEFGVEVGRIGQGQAVERGHRRIGDGGIGRLAVARAVVGGAADRPDLVEIETQLEIVPITGVIAQPGANGSGIGIQRLAVVASPSHSARAGRSPRALRDDADQRQFGMRRRWSTDKPKRTGSRRPA